MRIGITLRLSGVANLEQTKEPNEEFIGHGSYAVDEGGHVHSNRELYDDYL
jgi:hypothetical protein